MNTSKDPTDPFEWFREEDFSNINFEKQPLGFHTVDPANREFAATDEDLFNILDTSEEGIPKDRIPFFKRLLQLNRDIWTNSFYGPIWKGGEHEIHLQPNTVPIKSRTYRFSKEHMEILKKLLEKWQSGIGVLKKRFLTVWTKSSRWS